MDVDEGEEAGQSQVPMEEKPVEQIEEKLEESEKPEPEIHLVSNFLDPLNSHVKKPNISAGRS
jgi:hypothetical protein